MNQEEGKDRLIEQYLLGGLPPHEQEQVESRYFADPEFLERMDAIEEELIEDYTRGALSQEKARQIEQQLLSSPYQQQKVRFTRTLLRAAEETSNGLAQPEATRESWWQAIESFFRSWSFSTIAVPAAAVLLLASGWLTFKTFQMGRQLEQARQEQAVLQQQAQVLQETVAQQKQRIEQISGQSPTPLPDNSAGQEKTIPPPPPTNFAAILLLPSTIRGGGQGPQTLPISHSVNMLKLQLAIDEGKSYSRYHAILETADGDELLQRSGLRAISTGKRKIVTVELPASSLENRTYVVTLKASNASGQEEELHRYEFRAVRQ